MEVKQDTVGVVMLITPREDIGADGVIYRFFEFIPAFNLPAVRVEWDAESMNAVIPADVASIMVKRGYARLMTESEIDAYTAAVEVKPVEPAEPVTDKPADPDADKPVEPETVVEPVTPTPQDPVVEAVTPTPKEPEKATSEKTSKKPKRG